MPGLPPRAVQELGRAPRTREGKAAAAEHRNAAAQGSQSSLPLRRRGGPHAAALW